MSARRVLVTGGSGFVGANLAARLVADGHDVHLLLRDGFRDWRIAPLLPHVQVQRADLLDREGVRAAVARARPDWIFHLAAYGAYSWQGDGERAFATNHDGTVSLLEAGLARGFAAFVHAGSSSEYGVKDHAPAEDEPLDPQGAYAVAKAAATEACLRAAQEHGRPIVTLRLYSAYGPYEEPGRLLPALVLHGLRGEWPPLVSPDVARDFVHVDDVVDACVFVAGRASGLPPGAVYNVGTGVEARMRDVVALARDVFGIAREPAWGSMPDRPWDATTWRADARRLRALGWAPRIGLREGLVATADWFREHLPRLAAIYGVGVTDEGRAFGPARPPEHRGADPSASTAGRARRP